MSHIWCEVLCLSNNIFKNGKHYSFKIVQPVYNNQILITEFVNYEYNSVITIIDFLLCY